MDFNINHYLVPEKKVEWAEDWGSNFYGEIEDKPPTEQALLKAQDEFFEHRDMKVWTKMYGLCYQYMGSLLKKRLVGKKFMQPEEVAEKTSSATLKFMSQYLTKPDFRVGASFAGMMGWKIVEVLAKPPKDNTISLDSQIDDDSASSLEDLISSNNISSDYDKPEDAALKENFSDVLNSLCKEADAVLGNNQYDRLLFRMYLLLCIRHPKSRHAKRIFMSTWATNYKDSKLLEYILMEFKNRLTEIAY